MTTITGNDIAAAQQLLQQGEVVAIPTETVYGLAANALMPEAVTKIFAAKNRPRFNPLIIHIAHWQDAAKYVCRIPETAQVLADHFVPGPLTFLLPKKEIVPDIVTAGSPLVAIRVPAHPLTRELLAGLSFPLAAPSANQSGYISPTSAAHVSASLDGKIPYILDGGSSSVGLESTIIGFDGEGNILLYREGGIGREALETVSGKNVTVAAGNHARPQTSGQLLSHYAPHTSLFIGSIPDLYLRYAEKKVATISFRTRYDLPESVLQFILSENGDLNEAAAKLFDVMRRIDESGVSVILTEIFPEKGLGRAINDRLHRAQTIFRDL